MLHKISVIVPCYNQAQYLDECLQSVLGQTYEHWECIIVDDGSPDHTAEVAARWTSRDPRFKYLRKENGGLPSARNAGITVAEGEWILPLDADDYISENYLELAQKHFNSQKIKVIYCKARKFGIVNKEWILPQFSLLNLAKDNLIFCSAFFRKNDWANVGGYDQIMVHGLEDWDFWIRMLRNGGNVQRLEEECFYYRTKLNSMLTTFHANSPDKTIKYIEKKHIDFFHEHLGTFHSLSNQNVHLMETFDAVNSRFLNRVANKLYSLLDSF